MRAKILSSALENWLIVNYSSMSNEDIAQELSKKVQEENQVTIAELRRALPMLPNVAMKVSTLKRIDRLENFNGVTVDFVKKNAKRLNCPKKSHSYISQMNRQKSTQKAVKEWKEKAELVPQPFSWFRTLKINQTYFVRFLNEKNLASFRSSLNNYNRNEGPSRGMFLFPDFYAEDLLGRICVSPIR